MAACGSPSPEPEAIRARLERRHAAARALDGAAGDNGAEQLCGEQRRAAICAFFSPSAPKLTEVGVKLKRVFLYLRQKCFISEIIQGVYILLAFYLGRFVLKK